MREESLVPLLLCHQDATSRGLATCAQALGASGAPARVIVIMTQTARLTPDWAALDTALDALEARWRAQVQALGWHDAVVEVALGPAAEALDAARQSSPDMNLLVIHGEEPQGAWAAPWVDAALACGMCVGWAPQPDARPVRHIAIDLLGGVQGAPEALALARRCFGPEVEVTLVGRSLTQLAHLPPRATLQGIEGWPDHVEAASLLDGLSSQRLAALAARDVALVMVPTQRASDRWSRARHGLIGALSSWLALPVMLVPTLQWSGPLQSTAPLHDAVVIDGLCAWRVERRDAMDLRAPVRQGALRWSLPGGASREVEVTQGHASCAWPDDTAAAILTMQLIDGEDISTTYARVLTPHDPDARPIVLCDAAAPPTAAQLERFRARQLRVWAVRMAPSEDLVSARANLAALEIEVLLDAGAILLDGYHEDWPAQARPVRLGRLARWLQAAGYEVIGALGATGKMGALDAWLDAGQRDTQPLPSPTQPWWRRRLVWLAGAHETTAQRVHLTLDNALARQELLAALASARQRVCLQIYIFENDAVTRQVVDALRACDARGVAVRLLVDGLYSFYGAPVGENPMLAELAALPHVEVAASRPLEGVPDLRALKLRDHRKLLIIDASQALLTGRNLGAPYYTGFDEVALTEHTSYRDVPWLDASATLTGEVVGALTRSFAASWEAATGVALEPLPPAQMRGSMGASEAPLAPGPIHLHLIDHEGMRETRTLDLYSALIDSAQRQITVINTFPLAMELVEALRRALSRGVSVRLVVGNVRPLWGEGEPFPGGVHRDLATQVIHGRLDALASAGAQVIAARLPWRAPWDEALHWVWPHVHAKLVSVDGARFTVGSANLDLTASYWESELVALIEDEALTAKLDEALAPWLDDSPAIDPSDAAWVQRAARRAWLAASWPGILG